MYYNYNLHRNVNFYKFVITRKIYTCLTTLNYLILSWLIC